jgi:exodeoxyribonuclease VII small subunit
MRKAMGESAPLSAQGRGAGGKGDGNQPTFEELLANLEAAIAQLAGGAAPLDELVAAHERAVRLLAEAEAKLAELKTRAEQTAQSLAE